MAPQGAVPPAWLPGSVGSAATRGDADADDLVSGRAWDDLIDGLRRAGAVLRSERAPSGLAEQVAGYRHLLVLLALGIDEALRSTEPADPYLKPGNVDAILSSMPPLARFGFVIVRCAGRPSESVIDPSMTRIVLGSTLPASPPPVL